MFYEENAFKRDKTEKNMTINLRTQNLLKSCELITFDIIYQSCKKSLILGFFLLRKLSFLTQRFVWGPFDGTDVQTPN